MGRSRIGSMRPKWGLGLGIGLVTGLVLWLFSGPPLEVRREMPLFLWVWAPVVMTGMLIYAELIRKEKSKRWWQISGLVGLMTIYAIWVPQWLMGVANRQYENLMIIHLPLLAWIGVGGYLLGFKAAARDRLAVLSKSLELMVMAGIFVAVGGYLWARRKSCSNHGVDCPGVGHAVWGDGGDGLGGADRHDDWL